MTDLGRRQPVTRDRPNPAGLAAAALRAHSWPATVVLASGCLLVGVTASTLQVSVPLVDDPVPIWILLTMAAAVLVLPPLASAFPELEPTLRREPGLRAVRVMVAVGLAAVVLTPPYLTVPAGPPRHVLVVLALLLVGVGVAAVPVLGELAWSVPLGAGLVIVVTEGGLAHPVTSNLRHLGVPVAVLLAAAAVALFIWRGPRRPG